MVPTVVLKLHIRIINIPSLYYQVFRKHLFAAANLKSLPQSWCNKKDEQIAVFAATLLVNQHYTLSFIQAHMHFVF